jgi:hypothetical protein
MAYRESRAIRGLVPACDPDWNIPFVKLAWHSSLTKPNICLKLLFDERLTYSRDWAAPNVVRFSFSRCARYNPSWQRFS